jgi:hypothetical protein
MCASRSAIRLALVVLALSASGCSFLYRYYPVDAAGYRLREWSETVEGVRFSAFSQDGTWTTGRDSSFGTEVGLDVTNKSDKEVVVLGGQLLTNGRTIKAHFPDPPNRDDRTVPAGKSRSVPLLWNYGGGFADQVLGPDITFIWQMRIGKAEHSLRVPMQRERNGVGFAGLLLIAFLIVAVVAAIIIVVVAPIIAVVVLVARHREERRRIHWQRLENSPPLFTDR